MRIAVITPAFNAAGHLGGTIRSVQAQTHRDWRMVVVDDGSTDGTAAVVERITDPRVTLVRQPNRGVSLARMAGLAVAEGEAVLFLDADDQLAPEALDWLATALADAPWAVAAVGAYARVAPDRCIGPTVPAQGGDMLRRLLVRNRFINGGHVLIRREAVAAAGPFHPELRFGEDWEFWVRLALVGEFVALGGRRRVLYACDRAEGAYRRLAADPLSFQRCLDVIYANPALPGRIGPARLAALRRHADAEAAWVIARELLRQGERAAARPWLRRSVAPAPNLRRTARLLAGVLLPRLPRDWRGTLRPYAA